MKREGTGRWKREH